MTETSTTDVPILSRVDAMTKRKNGIPLDFRTNAVVPERIVKRDIAFKEKFDTEREHKINWDDLWLRAQDKAPDKCPRCGSTDIKICRTKGDLAGPGSEHAQWYNEPLVAPCTGMVWCHTCNLNMYIMEF